MMKNLESLSSMGTLHTASSDDDQISVTDYFDDFI